MTEEIKKEIARMRAAGEPVGVIAEAYGLDVVDVADVCEDMAAEIATRGEDMKAAGLFIGEDVNA